MLRSGSAVGLVQPIDALDCDQTRALGTKTFGSCCSVSGIFGNTLIEPL